MNKLDERRFVRNQAEQDGLWLRAGVWFQNTCEPDLRGLTDACVNGDAAVIRALPDDLLEAAGRIAGIALRELACRAIERMNEAA